MSFTNITKPVVFNVSLQPSPKIDNFIRRFCIVSAGDTNLTQGGSKIVTNSDWVDILKDKDDKTTDLYKAISSYFGYSNNRPVVVLETKKEDSDLNLVRVQALDNFIKSGLTRCYMYLLPKAWYEDSSPLATILEPYNKETAQQYFMIQTGAGDPLTDSKFQQFKNNKCLMCVFDNTEPTFATSHSLTGALLGLIASSKFDITITNKATPLNFKTLTNYQFTPFTNDFIKNLINAPVNFVFDEIGLPTIGNGRYTDGSTFEYWYQWDLTQVAINNKLTTMIVMGANNPQYVVRYNQQGIDTLTASIKSVLANQINLGCINSFSKSVDPITGDMVGEGDITAIEFNEYIKNNPEDYKNEIYNGISFYIMIGRYIRQVVVNVTLN